MRHDMTGNVHLVENCEGITWPYWYAAATLGKACCAPNAWGACSSECPRIHPSKAPEAMRKAWRDGVDPTDWKASYPIPAGTTVRVNAHKSEPGKGLSYPCMQVVLSEPCETNGWDVIDATLDGSEVSIYSFSVVRDGTHY